MNTLNSICIVRIADGLGYPELGVNFQSTLNQKNSHGSSILLNLLGDFSKCNESEMRLTNEQSHDDFWILDFLAHGHRIARIHLNLRKFTKHGTEWGLWTDEPSDFTNKIREFLDQTPAIEVAS